MERIQTVTVQTESIRRDFSVSVQYLFPNWYRTIYQSESLGGNKCGAWKLAALLHVKVNVLPCVHADACLIFYLESFASGPIEYSTRATSYRCMRAANQILLSVSVHARAATGGHNRISRLGNSTAAERSDKGQITKAPAPVKA